MPGIKCFAAFFVCLSVLFCGAAAHAAVDFDVLEQLNPDSAAWIYQAESGLNQPVMQHETDDWYRERGFDEVKIYKTGSVYLHAADSLQDGMIVLRGQAREEGSLHMIPQWREQETADSRSPFYFFTPQGGWMAKVFACVAVPKGELDGWLAPEQTALREAWLARAQEESLIRTGVSPSAEDRLLLFAAEALNGHTTLLMTRLQPVSIASGVQHDLSKAEMDARQTQNGWYEVGPAGEMMVYAQNDPLYETMRYESAIRNDVHRDFGGGGCGPTAMAIIVANLVEKEELPRIGSYARNELGNLFCPCSVNRVYCNHTHVPYHLETPEEYLRYLPVAMADFAAGNNQWELVARRVNSQGTNIRFVDYVCEVYGLQMQSVDGLEAGLALMKESTGSGLMLTSALRGSPYTNNSHFVVIAAVDDEYMYIIDPLRRTAEEYKKTDKRELLEVLAPGVTRIRLEDYGRCDLSPYCYITLPR